jgi:uncharacterized protein with ParB-like and HNH nuclease domain
MSRIENFKFNIEDAFRECFYIVPDYQREYVWTDKEIHQLLDDINDDINGSAKEYFIGTILVSPTTDNKHYEVIDGQQRLTTFFLILCALKHLFSGESQAQLINELISSSYTNDVGDVVTALKLDPRYENASELMTKLVKIGSDPATTKATILASGIPTFGSLENLLNAYDTVSLKKYWAYLARNVVFIQISTDVSSALKIFETINERGIGLNPMDLLKNLLFTQINKDEFTKLKDKWKKITAPLEKKKEKPLRFLRYYLMANYRIENSRNDYIVREDEIYDWFTNKRNAALCDYQNRPFDFVQHVINNVDRFIDYSSGRGNDGQYNLQMINLKELCGGAFSLHYILLLAASSFPKYLFDHFIVQLESFLFYYIFTKTTTRDLERNFSLWAEELRQIGKEVDRDRQIEGYNRFLTEEFSRNILTKELELSDYLKRYSLNSMQRYRTHYLLAKLTQYVDMAYKGVKTFGALSEYTDLEIELILPNNPRAELRNDFVSRNPEKDYDEYKSKLGNLTLLEKPINIVASNDFFSKKCEEYKKSKYYLTSSIGGLIVVGNNTSINRMNQILLHFEDWSAASIDERQSMLSRLAKEIWKIEEYR